MADLMIRRALAADSARLTAICRSSAAYRGVYAQAIATVEVTKAYITENFVFVANDSAERILGFYSLICTLPELDMLFVADDVQRQGVGQALIAHMIQQARQVGTATVRVVSHPSAEEFYLRVGAQRTGTVAAQPPTTTWDRPELHFAVR